MNPAALLLGIAVLTVIGGIAYGALASARFLAPSDKIWLFGDSIGVGLLPKLQDLLPGSVSGNPIGGTTIQHWDNDNGSIADARGWGATIALVVLGTNDAAATPAYREQVYSLAADYSARLQASGLRVFWVGPGAVPKWPAQGIQVQNAIRAALAGTKAVVVDPSVLAINKPDKVHPDPTGYATMAAWIVDRMNH